LRDFLVEKRKEAGLRQVDLAKRLKRRQDYVSYVETGQKLVEVVELMEWAEAIGFDARDAIKTPMIDGLFAYAKIAYFGKVGRAALLRAVCAQSEHWSLPLPITAQAQISG
jgi:transcriptional regulator with XRE-family HTH domain